MTSINLLLANETEDRLPQNVFICDLRVLARKLACPFGHPTQVSTQVQLASNCDHLPVGLTRALYIGEAGRRLGDRFREHLRDVEKDDKNASKPVAGHFNLPNHSMQHMTVRGLSLHQGNRESRKTLEQKFIFQIGTLNPHGINERFPGI